MILPSVKNLLRRALLDYYKEQGLKEKELYQRVLLAEKEHIERRKRYGVHHYHKALG